MQIARLAASRPDPLRERPEPHAGRLEAALTRALAMGRPRGTRLPLDGDAFGDAAAGEDPEAALHAGGRCTGSGRNEALPRVRSAGVRGWQADIPRCAVRGPPLGNGSRNARRSIARLLPRPAADALRRADARAAQHDIALKRWVRPGRHLQGLARHRRGGGDRRPRVRARAAGDFVAPMIRNAGACPEMGMPLADMFRAYLATADSPSARPRLTSATWRTTCCQPDPPVGVMVPVVAGIALRVQDAGPSRVVMNWVGDGSREGRRGARGAQLRGGPAAAGRLHHPEQPGGARHAARPAPRRRRLRATGRPRTAWRGGRFDGNNVLDAYAAAALAVERCRRGEGPVLLAGRDLPHGRPRDARRARGARDVRASLFEHWGKRDPMAMFEEHLVRTGISRERLAEAERSVEAEVDAAEGEAMTSRAEHMPSGSSALSGVYAEGGAP